MRWRFALALAAIASTARAQDAGSQRTIALDVESAVRSLRDDERWTWLTKDNTWAIVDHPQRGRAEVFTPGARAVVTLRPTRDGFTRATCLVTLWDPDPDPYVRWSSAWESANNLCDHVAREATPRWRWQKGYSGFVVVADILAGPAYPFAGPIVHLANKRPLTALASFGVRVGSIGAGIGTGTAIALLAPPAAFFVVGRRGPPPPNYLPQVLVGILIGGISGIVAATIFDALYLARGRFGPDGFVF